MSGVSGGPQHWHSLIIFSCIVIMSSADESRVRAGGSTFRPLKVEDMFSLKVDKPVSPIAACACSVALRCCWLLQARGAAAVHTAMRG